MSDRDVVIRVENISKLYRLGEVGTGSLAHDVNRWWHKVRGKEDPYLKIGEVNDRTKSVSSVERPESSAKKRNLTTEDTESTEGTAGLRLAGQAGAEFPNPSTSELARDSESVKFDSLDPSRLALAGLPSAVSQAAAQPPGCGKKSSSEALVSRPSSLVSPKAPPSDWVYALKDVSFEVKRGEVLGIIGRNGAGKSTLLKILSRVTTQSSGQIKVKGRIASLLEVGTGFHPQLTGRENIFLNGAILGMRKAEIARKFDEIVEFSGCARYIDTPVKRYSSGMYVRLAFAVAAHLEPEILIVDEVLAVGDAEFQKKCLGKMKDVAGHGRTILFVSHNMTAVQSLCSRCLVMQNGFVEFAGHTVEAIQKYYTKSGIASQKRVWENLDEAPGSEVLKVKSVKAISLRADGENSSLFDMKTSIDIHIDYRILKKQQVHITLHFLSEQGEVVFTSGCRRAKGWQECPDPGDYELVCQIPANLLNEKEYFLKILIVENGNKVVCQAEDVLALDVKDLEARSIGDYHGREPGPISPLLNWKLLPNKY
jgi:lipopolysaccharide transport system ATP-binding protein